MQLYPFRFTTFIGLYLTLTAVLVACPSHVNQAISTNQLIDTVTVANHATATNVSTSSAVEVEWMGGSNSEADQEWLNSLVDAFNRAHNERHHTANLLSSYNKRMSDFVTDGSLEPYESPAIDSDESNSGLQSTFDCPSQDAGTLALVHNKQTVTDAEWVWDDLRKAAKALTDKNKDGYDLSLSYDFAHQIGFLSQSSTATMPTHVDRSAW